MPPLATITPAAPPKTRLMDRVRNKIRLKHYSIRTEKACVDWVRRYVHFHGLHHPEKPPGRSNRTKSAAAPHPEAAVQLHAAAAESHTVGHQLLQPFGSITMISVRDLPMFSGWIRPAGAQYTCPALVGGGVTEPPSGKLSFVPSLPVRLTITTGLASKNPAAFSPGPKVARTTRTQSFSNSSL